MTGKKKFAAILIISVLIALAIGYYMWNKPHRNVKSATALKTEASTLYSLFVTDSVSAIKKFYQQVVEVSGTVTGISKNQQNQTVVLLKSGIDGANLNCTMEGNTDKIVIGKSASIKGICEGLGQGDADLGILGDLYLIRCYLTDLE